MYNTLLSLQNRKYRYVKSGEGYSTLINWETQTNELAVKHYIYLIAITMVFVAAGFFILTSNI